MITSIIALSAAALAARKHASTSSDEGNSSTSAPLAPELRRKSRRSAIRPLTPPLLERTPTLDARRHTTKGAGHSDWDRDAWGHIIVCSSLSPSSMLSPSLLRAKSHPRDREARGMRKLSAPPSFFDCAQDAPPWPVNDKGEDTFIELKEVRSREEGTGSGRTPQGGLQDAVLPAPDGSSLALGGGPYTPIFLGRCVQKHF